LEAPSIASLWSNPFGFLFGWFKFSVKYLYEQFFAAFVSDLPPEIAGHVRFAVTSALGVALGAIPGYLYLLAFNKWQRLRYFEARVEEGCEAFVWIGTYLDSQKKLFKDQPIVIVRLARDVKQRKPWWSIDNEEDALPEKDELRFELPEGEQTPDFHRDGVALQVKKVLAASPAAPPAGDDKGTRAQYLLRVETAPLLHPWAWGATQKAQSIIKKFIIECKEAHEKAFEDKIVIKTTASRYGELVWAQLCTRNKRPLDSMFFPGTLLADIVEDCRSFLRPEGKKRYASLGVPYRRGYLLYGAPGCGKSQAIIAIASELSLPLCYFDVSAERLTDSKLQMLFNSAPSPSILVFEEIDTLFGLTEETTSNKPPQYSDEQWEMLNASKAGGGFKHSPPPPPPPPPTKPAPRMTREELKQHIALLTRLRGDSVTLLEHIERELRPGTGEEGGLGSLGGNAEGGEASLPAATSGGGRGGGSGPAASPRPAAPQPASAPAAAPFPTPTVEWKALVEVLTQFRFEEASGRFARPLEDFKHLKQELGESSVALQVTMDSVGRVQKAFFENADIMSLKAALGKLRTKAIRAEKEWAPRPPDAIPYKSKAKYRTPKSGCSFGGLLQALDGGTAQEGRLVFFTTNHSE